MRKTTVYLSDGTERRIRRAARTLGVSRAQITRTALDEYLGRVERNGGGLPPSVGMGENPATPAADYEMRLARHWDRALRPPRTSQR